MVDDEARDRAKHATTRLMEPAAGDEKLNSDGAWRYLRFVPIAMLVMALFPLPYEYYSLLRVVVCGSLIYLFFNRELGSPSRNDVYVILLAIFTYLYNPLIPVHLNRGLWVVINLLTIPLLLGFMRRK